MLPRSTIAAPTDIPGCLLWLDGADQSTMSIASGRVAGWQDKASGYSLRTAAEAATRRPLASPSIRGTVPDFSRAASSNLSVDLDTPVLPGNTSFAAATLRSNSHAHQRALSVAGTDDSDATTYYAEFESSGNTAILRSFPGETQGDYIIVGTNDTAGRMGDCYLGVALRNSGSSPFYYDGDFAFSSATSWDGPIYEVIIYGRVLTDREIQAVKWYLSLRWGIRA